MTEKELLAAFQQAFKDGDDERVEALKEAHEDDVDDIEEAAFHAAVLAGNYEYCAAHIDEFDLNTDDGLYCSYLDETDNRDILQLLFDCGAIRNPDYYDDCRLLISCANVGEWYIHPDFAEEIFAKLLEVWGITEVEFCENYRLEAKCNEGKALRYDSTYDEIVKMLGATVTDDNKLEFGDYSEGHGLDFIDLLDELGFGCDFDGTYGRPEGYTGNFYIK